MKKYWYAAVTADEHKTIVDSAKTLKELGENLGLGLHVINYYYQNERTNRKLGVDFIRIPAITEEEMLRILKHGFFIQCGASGKQESIGQKTETKKTGGRLCH